MPEGDTIRRVARWITPLLLGRRLRRVASHGGQLHGALAGEEVSAVTPVGKHLTITLAPSEVTIRCHLGMRGRWRRFAPGEAGFSPGRRSPRGAGLVLETDRDVLVCFGARDVTLLRRRDPRAGAVVARLGPDLLAEGELPLTEILRRARAYSRLTVGELLLDQRVACGIGNVYKSELLFIEGVDPFAPVSSLDDEQLEALYRRAAELMRANLGPGLRCTTGVPLVDADGRAVRRPAARHWVYRRAARGCFCCGEPIVSRLQGEQARRTYLCPRCQAGVG